MIVYIFEHVQWRWAPNGRLARGYPCPVSKGISPGETGGTLRTLGFSVLEFHLFRECGADIPKNIIAARCARGTHMSGGGKNGWPSVLT